MCSARSLGSASRSFPAPCLLPRSCRAGACRRWAHRHLSVLQSHQYFRRGTHDLEVLQVHEIHVRRGIERAQRAVEIERRGGVGNRQALRQHHLHDVAGTDVRERFLDRLFKRLLRERRHKIALGHGLAATGLAVLYDAFAKFRYQFIEPAIGLVKGIFDCRIDVDDDVELALEVVEYNDFVRHRQQNVRCANNVGLGHIAQTRLDVTNRLVAEVTHEPAGEARQAVYFGHGVTRLEGAHGVERVGDGFAFENLAILFDRHVMAADALAACAPAGR